MVCWWWRTVSTLARSRGKFSAGRAMPTERSGGMTQTFNTYLLPGLVFMAVVIGGGYSTGRELIEFFGAVGPVGGLLGMLVTMLVWSAVLAISFELVRTTPS